MKPLVSVCIPTYRCARFLPAAIDSVLSQDYSEFELIVQDNCSQDGTGEILEDYASRDPRVDYRINESNIGMVANWNFCLRRAKGKYIKFLCADDLLATTDALALYVAAMEADPQVSLVASSRQVIDEYHNKQKVLAEYPAMAGCAGTAIIRDCLLAGRNKIGEISSAMFRKDQASRGFNNAHHHSADLEMFFYLLKLGHFSFIDTPLAFFRVYAGQQTALAKKSLEDNEISATFAMLQRYVDDAAIGLSKIQRCFVMRDYLIGLRKKNKKGRVSSPALRRVESSLGDEGVMARLRHQLYRVWWKRLGVRCRRSKWIC